MSEINYNNNDNNNDNNISCDETSCNETSYNEIKNYRYDYDLERFYRKKYGLNNREYKPYDSKTFYEQRNAFYGNNISPHGSPQKLDNPIYERKIRTNRGGRRTRRRRRALQSNHPKQYSEHPF